MGISREKNLPAHFAPLPQEEERRVGGLSIPPGHAAGVDLQKCRVGVRRVEGLQRRMPVAEGVLVKEAAPGVEFGDKV